LALRRYGIDSVVVFDRACSEVISAHRERILSKRLMLLTSDRGRPSLIAELTAVGASVESAAIYSYAETFPDLAPLLDAIVLPSFSAAQLLLGGTFADSLRALPTIAIGARTTKTAMRLGSVHLVQSARETVESLITTTVGQLDGIHHPTSTMKKRVNALTNDNA
jgi:uroporphyrinogen-III synthase